MIIDLFISGTKTEDRAVDSDHDSDPHGSKYFFFHSGKTEKKCKEIVRKFQFYSLNLSKF